MKFGEAIWQKADPFMERQKPQVVYLTGGGALIPPVADYLKGRIKERRIGVGAVQGGGKLEPLANVLQPWRSWEATGEGLQRMATAIGGTSVYLQSAPVQNGALGPLVERQPYTMEGDLNYEPCICPGGNKDCCFCGGTGWRLR